MFFHKLLQIPVEREKNFIKLSYFEVDLVTLICPTLNEEGYIENVLRFFVNSSPVDKELYIIDGGSQDKTKEIVKKWQSTNNKIFLFENSDKYVPFALNIGINHSSGDPIIRLDAHTEYSDDYILKILEIFNRTNADIVGGPMNPVGKSSFQNAVSFATMSKFGIGGSKIHDIHYDGYTDHVYLGAWRRNIFNEIGYFDTLLIRNQDDEFDYRAKSKGKKIFQSHEIKSFYYPRSNILLLIKQYYQYGLFKPLVLRNVPSEMKIRHIIPALFGLYFLMLFIPLFKSLIFFVPLIMYLVTNLFFSFINSEKLPIKLILPIIFSVIHLSYGYGFILGLGYLIKHEKRQE